MYWSYIGRIEYKQALELQERLRGALGQGVWSDTLLLLEHPRVITLGRSAHNTNVLVSDEELKRLGVDLFHIGRGGDVTYHGPGQLVGYPIRRVGRMLRAHVEGMANAIVAFLSQYGIESSWRKDHPGVWCGTGKIAAVGVEARGGITTHGFAFNVSPQLSDFQMIVPCGLTAPVTSMQQLLGEEKTPALEDVARAIAIELSKQYQTPLEEISFSQLMSALK